MTIRRVTLGNSADGDLGSDADGDGWTGPEVVRARNQDVGGPDELLGENHSG